MGTKTYTVRGSHEWRSNDSPSGGSWSTETLVADSTVTTSGNIRDWNRRIRLGQSATTYLDGRRYVLASELVHLNFSLWTNVAKTTWRGTDHRFHVGWALGFPAENLGSLALLKQRAYRGFWSKAKDACQDLSSGTVLGELRKTVGMIRRPLMSLRQAVGSYAQSQKKTRYARTLRRWRNEGIQGPGRAAAAAASRAVSGSWLEFSFGVKPLLSDVHDGAKALAKALTYIPPREFISFSAREDSQWGAVTNRNFDAGFWTKYTSGNKDGNLTYQDSTTMKYRVYGAVTLFNEEDYPANRAWADRFGLNWSDVLPTAWELIPGSFLADYFLGIGDFVERVTFPRSRFAWVAEDIRRDSTRRIVAFEAIPAPIPYGSGTPVTYGVRRAPSFPSSSAQNVVTNYDRNYVDPKSMPCPPPDYRALRTLSSWTKDLNVAALVASRFA